MGIYVKSAYCQPIMFFWRPICPDTAHKVFEIAGKFITASYLSFGNNEWL